MGFGVGNVGGSCLASIEISKEAEAKDLMRKIESSPEGIDESFRFRTNGDWPKLREMIISLFPQGSACYPEAIVLFQH